MRDEEQREAIGAQAVEDAEKALGFVGSQHTGRFVKNKNTRAAQQNLQDFDFLLLTQRKITDAGIYRHRQLVTRGQLLDPLGDDTRLQDAA